MSERVSRKCTEFQLQRLANAVGETYGYEQGQWSLNRVTNGYEIHEKVESGGINHPFGHNVWKLKEIYDLCNFAMRAIQIDRKGSDYAGYWPWPKDKVDQPSILKS